MGIVLLVFVFGFYSTVYADFRPTHRNILQSETDSPACVYAADLDGDGDIDVLSASEDDNKIAWHENDGSGQFGSQQVISTSAYGSRSVYAADLDGDGDLDVLSVGDDTIAWHENNGAGQFISQAVITNVAHSPQSVHAADLDGDGDMDVLSASFYEGMITWYENE